MKNQEATHSLAYSLPMIEATSPVPENFSQFYYDDDRLTFFMKLPEGVAISTETEEPKEDGPVSYTHLDVYKRQELTRHGRFVVQRDLFLDRHRQF